MLALISLEILGQYSISSTSETVRTLDWDFQSMFDVVESSEFKSQLFCLCSESAGLYISKRTIPAGRCFIGKMRRAQWIY